MFKDVASIVLETLGARFTMVARMIPCAAALCIAAVLLHMIQPFDKWLVLGELFLLLCVGIWTLPVAPRTQRDEVLPALAIVLMAVGLVVIGRISPDLLRRQEIWIGISLLAAAGLRKSFDRFRVLAGYRYIWVLACIVAFLALMLFGTEVNGARLWIRLTPFVQFEPVEFIKLFIVLFMAAYLAETADVIARARWWSLRANLKHLGPLVLGWGASMSILVLQRDLGMALLLLAIFITMLYVATRRTDLVVGACSIFGVAALWAAMHYHYVSERIAVWHNPYRDPLGSGYQALQALYAVAAGQVSGTGYNLGMPGYIPEAATDYVWATWSEEFGLLGAIALLLIYGALVVRMLDTARRAPDLYAKLLATGLATTLGVQVIIIIAGVIGLMPLTGITLPFVSYGGSSLFANVMLVSLVRSISNDRRSLTPVG